MLLFPFFVLIGLTSIFLRYVCCENSAPTYNVPYITALDNNGRLEKPVFITDNALLKLIMYKNITKIRP